MNSLAPITTIQNEPLPASVYDSFLAYIDVRPTTARAYSTALKTFALYLTEHDIVAPSRADILAYKAHLIRNYKTSTVQTYITAVRIFFKWTANTNLYPNIADNIKGAKVDRHHKKDYLTSNQARQFFGVIDTSKLTGLRDEAMLALMITSGLRTIEVMNADVGDIRTVGDEVVLYVLGKGRDEKSEFVRLSHKAHQMILAYLNARALHEGTQHLIESAPLFASMSNNNAGQRLTTRSVSRIAKETFSKIGLNSARYSAHSLRHTCACLNILSGGSLEETQQLLRHSAITTTMIYAHYLDAASNKSSQRVEDAVFG